MKIEQIDPLMDKLLKSDFKYFYSLDSLNEQSKYNLKSIQEFLTKK